MKKALLVVLIAVLAVFGIFAQGTVEEIVLDFGRYVDSVIAAQDTSKYVCANDLEPITLTEVAEYDGFMFYATSDKSIVIESLGDNVREAEDGEIFDARIKLGGTGNLTSRSISFETKDACTLTVYLNSSSKTDARILVVTDETGAEVASVAAEPDTAECIAAMQTIEIPEAGTYFIMSKKSGINLYMIVVD